MWRWISCISQSTIKRSDHYSKLIFISVANLPLILGSRTWSLKWISKLLNHIFLFSLSLKKASFHWIVQCFVWLNEIACGGLKRLKKNIYILISQQELVVALYQLIKQSETQFATIARQLLDEEQSSDENLAPRSAAVTSGGWLVVHDSLNTNGTDNSQCKCYNVQSVTPAAVAEHIHHWFLVCFFSIYDFFQVSNRKLIIVIRFIHDSFLFGKSIKFYFQLDSIMISFLVENWLDSSVKPFIQ